jgi:hypothetical protein
MINNALYYPYIEFHDVNWIKAMAMYYENIYRIVPENIIPNDPEELQPLLEDSSIGAMIDPTCYTRDTASTFLKKREGWYAAALTGDDDEDEDFVKFHADKIDQQVKRLFNNLGYAETDSWIDLPIGLASNYMLFLANEIGKRNRLNLITDEWAPWTATTYFNLNGDIDECQLYLQENEHCIDDPFGLFCLIVSEIVPMNISEIPAEKIFNFRIKRKDEIANFRNSMSALYEELQKLEDPKVRYDYISGKIKDLKKAKLEYQKSADVISVKKWFGISFMGFPAPIALGSLFQIPTASTVALTAGSIALGGLFNIKNSEIELRKLQKENPVSLLMEMSNSFKNYTSSRGGGDMNFHAYNCMEEYVND